jgi:hypothetical protein
VYVSTPFLVLVDEYINMPYKFYGKRKIWSSHNSS